MREILGQIKEVAKNGNHNSITFKSAPSRIVRSVVSAQARREGYVVAFNTNGRFMIVFGKRSAPLAS